MYRYVVYIVLKKIETYMYLRMYLYLDVDVELSS